MTMTPVIRHLFLAQKKETPMLAVTEAVALEGHGLEGCRHGKKTAHGKRQVLLLGASSLELLGLAPGTLKENIVIEGLDLETMTYGQRLALGPEVVVEIAMVCVPCAKLNTIRPGLLKQSWGNRGMLAKVIRGGRMAVGDAVTVLDVNPEAPKRIQPKLPA